MGERQRCICVRDRWGYDGLDPLTAKPCPVHSPEYFEGPALCISLGRLRKMLEDPRRHSFDQASIARTLTAAISELTAYDSLRAKIGAEVERLREVASDSARTADIATDRRTVAHFNATRISAEDTADRLSALLEESGGGS